MIRVSYTSPARVFWLLQIGGWIGYVLVKGVAFPLTMVESLWIVGKGIVLTLLLRGMLRRLMAWPNAGARFAVAAMLACIAGAVSLGLSLLAADAGWVFDSPAAIAWLASAKGVLFEWLVYLVWTTAYLVIRYGVALAQSNRDLTAALDEARLKHSLMLRYQLDPHFLFNAMTSLRALIFEEPGRAASFLDHLAGFLRHCLTDESDGRTTLENEMSAMKRYLEIQKTRFEEKIEYRIELDPALCRVAIPTLLLQPLVENAVKYGRRSPGQRVVIIALTARHVHDHCVIEIRNTGAWPSPGDRTVGTRPPLGLANVRARLAAQAAGHWSFSIGPEDDDVVARIEFSDICALRKTEEMLHA